MIPTHLPKAEFSDDTDGKDGRGAYRYTLWRHELLDPELQLFKQSEEQAANSHRSIEYVQFIGLNPSTATEHVDDRTIARCMKFAMRWGFGSMVMTNIFAWRDTQPVEMKKAKEPTGDPHNIMRIEELARGAGLIVAAWSSHGNHRARAAVIKETLRPFREKTMCFAITAGGHPEHPLYVAADRALLPLPL